MFETCKIHDVFETIFPTNILQRSKKDSVIRGADMRIVAPPLLLVAASGSRLSGRRLRRGPLASAAFLRHLVTLASTSACLWLRRVMRSSARGSSCVFRANRAKVRGPVFRGEHGWD